MTESVVIQCQLSSGIDTLLDGSRLDGYVLACEYKAQRERWMTISSFPRSRSVL
jgi:hypothetical protein